MLKEYLESFGVWLGDTQPETDWDILEVSDVNLRIM